MERKGDWMLTYTGKQFWPFDPHPEEVYIEDIAHALSNKCRFNGQSIPFYSVAQHSGLVSRIVIPEQKLPALLHDAAEAYSGDMIDPVKRHLEERLQKIINKFKNYPGFQKCIKELEEIILIEKKIQKVIFEHFGIENYNREIIHKADKRLCVTEKRNIMAKSPLEWKVERDYKPLDKKIIPLYPIEAEELFLKTYNQLK